MPFVSDNKSLPSLAPAPELPVAPEPTTGEIWGAAFRLENSVVGAVDALTEKHIPDEDDFDIADMLDSPEKQGQFYAAPHRFYGVGSRVEYEQRVAQIAEEDAARQTLQQSGATGIFAGLVAGVLSPTSLIPAIGYGARGLQAFRQGMLLGASGAAIDATVLAATQTDRGGTDVAIDVIAGGVLGSILGPLAGKMDAARLARLQRGMVNPDDGMYGAPPFTPNHNEPSIPFDQPLVDTPDVPDVPATRLDLRDGDQVQADNLARIKEELTGTVPIPDHLYYGTVNPDKDGQFRSVTRSSGPEEADWRKVNRTFRTQREMTEWIADNAPVDSQRVIARRILKEIPESPVLSVRAGDKVPKAYADHLNSYASAIHVAHRQSSDNPFNVIVIRENSNINTAVHELLHAATWHKINRASKGTGSAADKRLLERVKTMQTYLADRYDQLELDQLDFVEEGLQPHRVRIALSNPQELITYALTDPAFVKWLKSVQFSNGRNVWSYFIHSMRKAFGIKSKEWSALDEILDILDESTAKPDRPKPAVKATPTSGGAAATMDQGAGKLKGIAGSKVQGTFVTSYGGRITESPVVQVINNKISSSARWFMAQLSDAGLVLEGNVQGRVTAVGGTVENRAKAWYTGLARSVQAIDDLYAEYLGRKSGPLLNTRNVIEGAVSKTKMSKHEFNLEIARAMREGAEYEGPTEAAKAAKQIRELVYDPMTKEAVRIGLIDEEAVKNVVGDPAYLNRMYDNDAIKRDKAGFINILADNFAKKLEEKVMIAVNRLKKRELTDEDLIEDLGLEGNDLVEARNRYAANLDALYNTTTGEKLDEIMSRKAMISTLQKKLNEAGGDPIFTMIDGKETQVNAGFLDNLRDQIRQLEEGFTEADVAVIDEIKRWNKRIRNLNRSIGASEAAQAKKLAKIDSIYENQIKTLEAMVRKLNRLDAKIMRFSDDQLEKELAKVRTDFDRVMNQLNSNEARAREIGDRSDNLELIVEKRYNRLKELQERLDNAETEGASYKEMRELLRESRDEALQFARDMNNRRALRADRLRQQAMELDPNNVRQRIGALKERMKDRRLQFREDWRTRGADDLDLDTGTADFKEFAVESARTITDRILGTYNRLPGMDIIQDVRGPELARVLDIPSREIEGFLHNDIEFVMRSYMRTLGADIEMFRKFGSVDAKDMFRTVNLEFERAQAQAQTLGEKQKIAKEQDRTIANLRAVVGRIRHEWGIPANPTGAAARLARVAQNINTLRFMGFVTVSSVPDLARLVHTYGLKRTMKNAIIPLIRDFKTFKMSAKEARLAGTALDIIIHTRAHQMMDILEDYGRLSKGERALEFATSRIGLIAAFDYWTTGMKQLAAVAGNAQLMDAIMDGVGNLPNKKSVELLAASGIDAERATNIARLLEAGGGGRVNGVALPNTEDWLNPDVLVKAQLSEADAREALNTYRAALTRLVDNAIVTPGVERPLWMDSSSLTFRLVGQFRSFAFASATKTVLAGMQKADMAVFNGSMISLALGGLSYYLWAMASGDKARSEMENAGLDKWIDEMYQRSGLMGSFSEVQKVLESIPATSNYASISGQRSTRRGGGDLLDAVGGPTLDLLERGARIGSQLDDPTLSTLHTMRTLLPYQNVFWAKQLYDMVEEGAGKQLGWPEKRQ